MKQAKKITIYDIAREARVSPATVSRIIKGSASVSEGKAERVRSVIEKYDFRPNAIAQALSETRTRVIGMVVADALNPYYNTLFTAFDQEATRNGYATLLMNTTSQAEGEMTALNQLIAQRTDAIILFGGRVDLRPVDREMAELLQRVNSTTPLILGTGTYGSAYPYVAVDHLRSMDLALEHLIGLGHRDIGFVYAGNVFYGTQDKLTRFREIMQEKGLPVREEWVIHIPLYDAPSGQMGIEQLMQCRERPTALIAINDTVAAGMLQALSRHGVRVPEDMSLIGFDNIFLTDLTTPTLSAVGYDYEDMARKLFEVTMQVISSQPHESHLIPPFLSAKASTAAPKESPAPKL